MEKALPLSKDELRLLSSLTKHRVRFMMVGLSAAALQGAPVVTEDVDLWFENLADPRLFQALRAVKAAYVPPLELNPPMLAGRGAEPFDIVLRMDGLATFAEEWKHVRRITVGHLRLPVLPLDRILASKMAAGREKDRRVIPALKSALSALQWRNSKQGNRTVRKTRARR